MAGLGRVSVVLFNLGGPDSLQAVGPFLFNLFRDPAIIALPNPLRWMIAKLISRRRAPLARGIYREMGGASPILEETQVQAAALSKCLRTAHPATEWQVEIAMRYWHPFGHETVGRVASFDPERIVLLPLYPQYSTTTTGSSAKDWQRAAAACGLGKPTRLICCYPDQPDFIAAQVGLIAKGIEGARRDANGAPLRLLLSAHGLPRKVIAKGDPYQWQVERTVAAITRGLEARGAVGTDMDVVTCYQSRVGPLEWIGPATEDEVKRAGADGRALVIAPIAFVSEHSETLVELDIEYANLARSAGVPAFVRVPALGADPAFIAGLAGLVTSALRGDEGPAITTGLADADACAAGFSRCPLAGGAGG